MKHVYLHIGLHKTGTTYMQKVFTDNREKLRSLDVEYPELGTEFLQGHHNLAWSFIPKKSLINRKDFTLDRFFTDIDSCKCSKILISSEDFDFLRPQQIEALRDRLSSFEVSIVVYIRQPLNALYSYWQESVKHGDTTPFNDYYFQILDKPTPLNYSQILDKWSAKFGIDALSIVVYDNLAEDNEDVALYCLQKVLALDMRVNKFTLPQTQINKASDIKRIELIRQLNAIYKDKHKTETISQEFGERAKQYLEAHQIEYSDKLNQYFSYDTMDLPKYQPLYQHFQQMQKDVMEKYGDRILNSTVQNALFKQQSIRDYKVARINSTVIREVLNLEDRYNNIVP